MKVMLKIVVIVIAILVVCACLDSCTTPKGNNTSNPIWSSTSWSFTEQSLPWPYKQPFEFYSISCALDEFCTAVGVGSQVSYESWPKSGVNKWYMLKGSLPGALQSVSCSITLVCWAADNMNGLYYVQGSASRRDDLTWAFKHIDTSQNISQVICSNVGPCLSLDGAGRLFEWKPGRYNWNQITTIPEGVNGSGITAECSYGGETCILAGAPGYALFSSDVGSPTETWKYLHIGGSYGGYAACDDNGWCLVFGGGSKALVVSPDGSISHINDVGELNTQISCVDGGTCYAITDSGIFLIVDITHIFSDHIGITVEGKWESSSPHTIFCLNSVKVCYASELSPAKTETPPMIAMIKAD